MMYRTSRAASRRRTSLRLAATVAIAALVWSSAALSPSAAETAAGPSDEPPSKLERQVESWVTSLSEQTPFRDWLTADSQISALGPGTHSWLVLFTKEGRDIGYMVVHAVIDGSFRLGEYGTGPYSLYSADRLHRSLIDSGLASDGELGRLTAVRHYVHPFAAAWEVAVGGHTYWLDAKTAEQLPVNGPQWRSLFGKSSPGAGIAEASAPETLRLNETFDPYDKLPWLVKEAPFPAKDARKLQKRLDEGKPLRYVTEPFGDAMLYAAPVIGYLRWSSGRVDIALDMAGTRFIPLDLLLPDGLFYR
ncbi:hypothetical protein [Cohnella hongkongensis]|uniref:Uncharacterized protein n=1 Tax=Cohnella hongkongensis TaxID=178337 RepID=A0ABV9F3X5_9BACL